jgi:hypothetical protein
MVSITSSTRQPGLSPAVYVVRRAIMVIAAVVRLLARAVVRTVRWFAAEPVRIAALFLILVLSGALGAGIGLGLGYLSTALARFLIGALGFG